MKLNTYSAILKHDRGIVRLGVTAKNKKSAVRQIMAVEGCPACAVKSLLRMTGKSRRRFV